MSNSILSSKIMPPEAGARQVQSWKDQGLNIVFTNGCFDILHFGHFTYLQQAKALGDKLVMGLNSDASIKRLKGESRPINSWVYRAFNLSCLESVDLIIGFEEDTPFNLISRLVPDILVKGGDWPVDQIVGSDIVLGSGGEVLSLPYHEGFSTTNLIAVMNDCSKQKGT